MRRLFAGLAAFALSVAGAHLTLAQQAPQRGAPAAPQPMGFFVTSVGLGKGANLGGLAGADAHLPGTGFRRRGGEPHVAGLPQHHRFRKPACRERPRSHRQRSLV